MSVTAPPANVLLVDDEPANLLVLEVILGPLGQDLVRARSGEEALRLLEQEDFAVVLLDLNMPGMDGFATARAVRGQERSRHTPIIFLTAYDSSEFPVDQAYRLGAVDYLVKPLVPDILRAKVAMFVELFQRAEQIRRLEHRLREQTERRFRAIIENSWDAVTLMTADCTIRYASPSTTRVLGYAPEELVGRSAFELMHPDDLPATGALFARLLEDPGASITAAFRYRRKDGSWLWLEGTGTNLLDEPSVQAVVGNFHDVSERKRAEAELRDRAEQLAEADRRKDEFLAMLGHELRNPLAPIVSAAQVLDWAGDEAESRWAREVIRRQAQHLTRLVDDLLDVSRVTRGKIQLRTEPVELTAVLARAVETSRPLLDARRHDLAVLPPPGPVCLEADPTRLAQVVSNLLNNAAKYTPEGGRIWLTAECGDGQVVLRVRDNGQGIAPEFLPHVFGLFTQGDRSPARSEGGLGIGLALVRSLVELHSGTVQARSDGPGKGSEFIVRLPLRRGEGGGTQDEEDPRQASFSQPPAFAPRPAFRVLVVDDNRDGADSVAMLLKLWGHEARVAYDGPGALEAAREFRPQLVLLDIGLPGMTGLDVARRLRQEPGLEGAVLAAMTGYGQEEDRRRTEEAGMSAHLVKPVDPVALKDLLARLAEAPAPART
jgi:PAS domain S-box-containing protein